MMNTRNRLLTCLATLGLTVVGAAVSSVRADSVYTPVQNNPNEKSVRSILNHTLGGTFVKDGVDFGNGALNVDRISDTDDKFWSGEMYDLRAVARFAAFSQSFGYLPGETGGSFVKLFDVTGSGFNVSGGASSVDLGDLARLARNGTGGLYTSDPDGNVDKYDHMIAYEITPAEAQQLAQGGKKSKHYMFFFEDIRFGGDRDYNDLVVEAFATAVPVPASVWGGAVLMTMLGVHAWRRKRQAIA